MTDHFARPAGAASSARVAELHALCDADYAKGQSERATPRLSPSYAPAATPAAEPSDLDVAIRVAQQLLDSDSVLSLQESLRLLLRALGAEPARRPLAPQPPARRCPAAHLEDPTPCVGPVAVVILDRQNGGARGCEHHGARLLASLDGGRVYPLPDAPPGTAIRVFKAAADTRPFAWVGERR
ncbi:hypothetical protein [Streptomyces sp. NPDC002265]|uniref:hypothetical protein n=1 Tax=Streptomyces sp. NPDC002265 TaxID=3154415 RepID=UPI00331E2642